MLSLRQAYCISYKNNRQTERVGKPHEDRHHKAAEMVRAVSEEDLSYSQDGSLIKSMPLRKNGCRAPAAAVRIRPKPSKEQNTCRFPLYPKTAAESSPPRKEPHCPDRHANLPKGGETHPVRRSEVPKITGRQPESDEKTSNRQKLTQMILSFTKKRTIIE